MDLCKCPRHSNKPNDMIFGKRTSSLREVNPKYANRISHTHSPTSVIPIKINFKKQNSYQDSIIKVTTSSEGQKNSYLEAQQQKNQSKYEEVKENTEKVIKE